MGIKKGRVRTTTTEAARKRYLPDPRTQNNKKEFREKTIELVIRRRKKTQSSLFLQWGGKGAREKRAAMDILA